MAVENTNSAQAIDPGTQDPPISSSFFLFYFSIFIQSLPFPSDSLSFPPLDRCLDACLIVMLSYVLRSLTSSGSDGSLARRWEFRDEAALIGSDRSLFIAMGVIALFSLLSTFGLLSFLTYRFVYWQRYYKSPLAQNQYVVLIYNLLLVDLQQAIAFTINLYWASRGSVHYGEAACYLQGWWIQTGDPGSGLFVLSIALHTGAVVMRGRQLPFHIFSYCVIGLWTFILILGFIPVGLYGKNVFVISEANWVCPLLPTYID